MFGYTIATAGNFWEQNFTALVDFTAGSKIFSKFIIVYKYALTVYQNLIHKIYHWESLDNFLASKFSASYNTWTHEHK